MIWRRAWTRGPEVRSRGGQRAGRPLEPAVPAVPGRLPAHRSRSAGRQTHRRQLLRRDRRAPHHLPAPGDRTQLTILTEDTDVVSITIGGNDTGLVAAAVGCVNLLPKPFGSSCAARNTKDGVDTVKAGIDAWAPKFGTALNQIKQRAPHAEVFVVGYGNYIRPGGCFPTQPMWDVDATYIQGATDHLSAALGTTARQHGATFVDAYSLGIGHDVCAAPADRYIEGLIPAHIATPLHPNAEGSKAIGSALASAVLSATRTG